MATGWNELSPLWDLELLKAVGIDVLDSTPSTHVVDMNHKVGYAIAPEHLNLHCVMHQVVPDATFWEQEKENSPQLLESHNNNTGLIINSRSSNDISYPEKPVQFLAAPVWEQPNLSIHLSQLEALLNSMKPGKTYLISRTEKDEVILSPAFEELFPGDLHITKQAVEELKPKESEEQKIAHVLKAGNKSNSVGRKLKFVCPLCPRAEATQSSLRTHMLSHGKPFCRLCLNSFKSQVGLKLHMKSKHATKQVKKPQKTVPPSPPSKISVTSRYGRCRNVLALTTQSKKAVSSAHEIQACCKASEELTENTASFSSSQD